MPSSATNSDYKDYFNIAEATPGTESWCAAIDQLIGEITADFKLITLPEQDAINLIGSLLSVRELGRPEPRQKGGRS